MAIRSQVLVSFLHFGRATFRHWCSWAQPKVATAAAIFLCEQRQTFHVSHLLCSSPKHISMQFKYWSVRSVKFMLLQATEGRKSNAENRQWSLFPSDSLQTKPSELRIPKKPNSLSGPFTRKIPTEIFLPSCESLYIIHSSKKPVATSWQPVLSEVVFQSTIKKQK